MFVGYRPDDLWVRAVSGVWALDICGKSGIAMKAREESARTWR